MWTAFLPGEFVDTRTPEELQQDEVFSRTFTRLAKEQQKRFEKDLINKVVHAYPVEEANT